jgi:hypothetical protein
MVAELFAAPASWASASICNAIALSATFALYDAALLFAALVAFGGRPLRWGATSASVSAVVIHHLLSGHQTA